MFRGFTVGKARAKESRLSVPRSFSLSSSLGLAVAGISLNREWRAGRPSCGRRDGIFIGLNIGKPPIRNAIPAPRLRSAPLLGAPLRRGESREKEEAKRNRKREIERRSRA